MKIFYFNLFYYFVLKKSLGNYELFIILFIFITVLFLQFPIPVEEDDFYKF